LGGRGTVAGVDDNGTLAPGNSVNTLNTTAETWEGGGSYQIEINNATGTAGTAPGWDLLNITAGQNDDGSLTVSATSGSKFTIKVVSLSGADAGACANFDNKQAYAWRIATASGGVSGFDTNAFAIDASGFVNSLGAVGAFSVSQSGNDVYLNFTPVFANAAPYGRAWGTITRLAASDLLSAFTTGNGTRALVSVATGSRGTAAIVSGGVIYLAPIHNLAETFQYVAQLTGYATSLATNTITLSVTNAVSAVNSVSSTGDGVAITFAGIPGYNYVVERSSSVSDWSSATVVQTLQAPSAGVWTFTDSSPPNPSFYRLRQNN
jgi:hypothetical protein